MINNFLKYWGPVYIYAGIILYAGIIFYLSGKPSPLSNIFIPFLDKLLHILEYTIFGWLAARAVKNSPRKILYKNFRALAILFSFLYGISDEIHQHFVPVREFSMLDILADGAGAILGAFIYGRDFTV